MDTATDLTTGKRSLVFVLLILGGGVLVTAGCKGYVAVAQTADDIRRLPADTRTVRGYGLSDTDIPALARLSRLECLDISAAPITDFGLERLSKLKLPKLDTLCLGYSNKITDSGLAHVAKMDTIHCLIVRGCPRITDAGMGHLAQMKNLPDLAVMGCPGVTDAGVRMLGAKTNWNSINFSGSPNVTAAEVAKLAAKNPNARIVKDNEWELERR
jgi:hypothetical protein